MEMTSLYAASGNDSGNRSVQAFRRKVFRNGFIVLATKTFCSFTETRLCEVYIEGKFISEVQQACSDRLRRRGL